MKKKIIVIGSYPDSLVNFRLHLMKKFLASGYEVVALAPQDDHVKKTLEESHIRFIATTLQRNGTNPMGDINFFFHLRRIFQIEKPNIVLAYTIKPVVYASLAARSVGIKKIYSLITGTGYVFVNKGLKSKLIGFIGRQLLKYGLKKNTKVFFYNRDNLNFFLEKKVIARDKPVSIINGSGVDCTVFYPAAYPASLSFLMIARLLSFKGVREYVAVARRLKQHYPDICCRLAGWIDTNPGSIQQSELDEWIKNGDIEYLGKLSDVRTSIANASVYVLPSWNEGMPRTILEAMAMARPIITTDTPGCRETVIAYHNGFLVQEKNVDELHAAMEYFVSFPEKIAAMGKASRHIALEKYDVHKINNELFIEMQVN